MKQRQQAGLGEGSPSACSSRVCRGNRKFRVPLRREGLAPWPMLGSLEFVRRIRAEALNGRVSPGNAGGGLVICRRGPTGRLRFRCRRQGNLGRVRRVAFFRRRRRQRPTYRESGSGRRVLQHRHREAGTRLLRAYLGHLSIDPTECGGHQRGIQRRCIVAASGGYPRLIRAQCGMKRAGGLVSRQGRRCDRGLDCPERLLLGVSRRGGGAPGRRGRLRSNCILG